jgi:uncharacterized protein YaeQ
MALKATIYKAILNICDQDRNYYEEHHLTLAKHPSETDERMMVRLLAFAMYADENLTFGKDISAEGHEPTLWIKDMTGDIDLWIEIGQPDEKSIRKACSRVKQVVLILYGAQTDLWWKHNQRELIQKNNLTVIQLPYTATQSLAAMAERTMTLTCNIEDEQITMMSEATTVAISPVKLLEAK